MRITPLQDFVLILTDKRINETEHGIKIPEDEAKMTYKATVIAVGEGKYESGKLVPMKTKVGDRVLHKSYGITSLEIDGVEHFVLEERNILGILSDE